MNNPIKIYNDIKDAYLKYINSGLPFFRDEYNQERNELLKSVGTISQPPIIELVPKYHEKATLKEFCINEGVSLDVNDFINAGLFVNNSSIERKLYDHQYDSLKEAFLNRKNIVVTTGTGSGKTECFLLPVISDLVRESDGWGDNRRRAIRTMILYPLNALAEDQMIRLRKALNSRRDNGTGALDWLDSNRDGHRFYFGRYTGRTPVSGEWEKVKTQWYEERRSLKDGWRAAQEAAVKNQNNDLLYHVPCMEADSGEMWDRFSMQENAPDILITNYSMLNVMLMRENEAAMFESTRQWLAEDPSHVFHLVIDELHTYRGTAGTEVAYLVRVLLDRLGLTPESPQVQFLASSASLEENAQSKDYLAEFFGYGKEAFSKRFKVLSNPREPSIAKPEVKIPDSILLDYSANDDENQLFAQTNCTSFIEVTEKYKLLDWLKFALESENGIIAKDVLKIASEMGFDSDKGLPVVSAIIKILCQSREGNNFVAPIRAHFFFRNVSGLWCCTDPNCKDKKHYDFEGRAAGVFYKRPRTFCSCGKNVLEVLVCENCGELFFGGHKTMRDSRTFLSAERPMKESFVGYCVLWRNEAPASDGWKRVSYNPDNGEYYPSLDGKYSLYEQQSENDTAFPHKCPQCEVKYRVEDKDSYTPIRRHGTGLQKVNQILADALIRSMKNEKEDNTKVVLFSDSRQSAAKLSAGIELDHYRDVMRWAILSALKGNESNTEFLKEVYEKKPIEVTDEEKMKLRQLQGDGVYQEIANFVFYKLVGIPPTEDDRKKIQAFFSSTSAQRLDNIEDNVFRALLSLGINPAGPKPSAFYNKNGGYWYDLFDFDSLKRRSDLSDNAKTFSEDIVRLNKIEQLTSIFSNRKRSFEELRLGYLAPTAKISDKKFYEYVCTVIRIMGEKKRIKDLPIKFHVTDSFPNPVNSLTKSVFGVSSRTDVENKKEELRVFLRRNGIIDQNKALLTGNGLSFVKAEEGAPYWECPKCKTIHMHHSNGFCSNCVAPLGDPSYLTKEDIENPKDYYLTVLNSTDKVYRLHCEEMSGQTSREDSQKRQRYFQDIFLHNENPQISGIDLLSVTTTMEAGVDIGTLSAVMMGNIPPQRFNYQQRVGRAGRRGNPLSLALTVAKGTSHDLTNFFEYERMVSDSPKDPYLEVRTKEIAERIIYKEVLYLALKTIAPAKGENVHGNFGKAIDWEKKKDSVQYWIDNNDKAIRHIIETVVRGTEVSENNIRDIEQYVHNGLLDRISEIACDNNKYNQEYLSERLANAGLLPMFGFPTMTRELFLKKPEKLPTEDSISREIDMALNSFAPGHEIVKDKKVYLSVGVVDYTYARGEVVPRSNSLNPYAKPLHRCKSCGYSSINVEDGRGRCPVCGELMEEIAICSPLGFCVDYNRTVEDFNGSYDWYSPNSDIKLDCEESLTPCNPVKNLSIRNNIIPSMGLVHLMNDNNGEYYVMGKRREPMYRGIYISKEAYPEDERNFTLYDEKKYAFVASKSTGVLTLAVGEVPDNINLSPIRSHNINSHYIRSAYISWGYLVRKSVASYLDIDSSELSVGFYITPGSQQAEVFFVEKLENGAGYCNYLSGRRYTNVPQKAILEPLLPGGEVYEHLVSEEHSKDCASSCYDCIRDYSNQSVHGLLDWRLGLDLARLANDKNATIDFSVSYWRSHLNKTIVSLLASRGYDVRKGEGTLVAVGMEGDSMIVVHPFWSEDYVNNLIEKVGGNPKPISICGLIIDSLI